jgi:alkylmercury lyase
MTATTDLLMEYAEQAGLSVASRSQQKLAPGTRAVHRAVLQTFLETGTAPSLDRLRDQTTSLGLDPDAALAELAEADLVHLDSGSVAVAYPFSGVPTNDHVQLDGGPSLWAMCAIDALGILLMTGHDGVIASIDPQSGQPIRVQRHRTRWEWMPDSTVVLAGVGQSCGRAAESCCPHMAFHSDAKRAEGYLRAHPDVSGYVLDHAQALEAAEFVFGPLLSGAGPEHTA